MRTALLLATSTLALAGVAIYNGVDAADGQHIHDDATSVIPVASEVVAQNADIPATAAEAPARLAASRRKAGWKIIKVTPTDSVIAWVVEPDGANKAPVVVVIHENMGLNPWTRGVADQLAADGFIAIAPDLITMKRAPGADLTAPWGAAGNPAIRTLTDEEAQRSLDAVAKFGLALPNANGKYGVVGFCWGGARSFLHAVHAPTLGAAVVYYGSSPTPEQMASIKAPVLGLYGGADARITATVPATDSAMQRLGKTYESHVFEGAGHGFLGRQDGQDGANLTASRAAWPRTIAWFKRHLAG